MTDQQILEKAVKKAIDGGWRPIGRDHEHPELVNDLTLEGVDKCYIFNHDFAKALWGEGYKWLEPTKAFIKETPHLKTDWQYHLQQMVIADDPIKYLGDNL